MRVNETATRARDVYRALPYTGGPDRGMMSGGFGVHRDSDPIERVNYRVAAAAYRAAGVEVREDSFGHWAVGWIDELTVPISVAAVAVLTDLRARIDAYPVLDDDALSAEEWEDDHPSDGRCYSTSVEDYGEQCGCGLPRWGDDA